MKSGLHLFSIKNGGMEDKMEQKEFTQELKNKRLASGLSQGQLAELLHIWCGIKKVDSLFSRIS